MKLIVYLNNKFIQVDASSFEKMLPGNFSGCGAFETMRLYNGVIFAFDEHMDRLRRGLKHFKIPLLLSQKRILKIVRQLMKKNKLKNARVRVIVWRERKLKHISISLTRLNLPSGEKYRQGFKVMTMRFKRKRISKSHIKSVNYKLFRKAFQEAQQRKCDEAILLNNKGEVVEGSRTNIFYVKDDILITPATSCGCLNGITRQKVIANARLLNIPVMTAHIKLAQLLKADEAFLTGSTLEVMPIRSVNGKLIGRKRPGTITAQIAQAYRQMVKTFFTRK